MESPGQTRPSAKLSEATRTRARRSSATRTSGRSGSTPSGTTRGPRRRHPARPRRAERDTTDDWRIEPAEGARDGRRAGRADRRRPGHRAVGRRGGAGDRRRQPRGGRAGPPRRRPRRTGQRRRRARRERSLERAPSPPRRTREAAEALTPRRRSRPPSPRSTGPPPPTSCRARAAPTRAVPTPSTNASPPSGYGPRSVMIRLQKLEAGAAPGDGPVRGRPPALSRLPREPADAAAVRARRRLWLGLQAAATEATTGTASRIPAHPAGHGDHGDGGRVPSSPSSPGCPRSRPGLRPITCRRTSTSRWSSGSSSSASRMSSPTLEAGVGFLCRRRSAPSRSVPRAAPAGGRGRRCVRPA